MQLFRRAAPLFLVVACWMSTAGCAAHRRPADTPSVHTVTTANGTFLVSWTVTPTPLPLNRMFELAIEVTALQPVDERNPYWLKVDAQMPEHNHGMNTRVVTDDLGAGKFRAHGLLFHMAGEWILSFNVAKGAAIDRAEVKLTIE